MASDKLTTRQCEAAQPRLKLYKLTDGKGLFLAIQPSGHRSWRLRFRHQGSDATLVLGTFPEYSLSEARLWRDEQRKVIARGVNPNEQQRAAKEAQQEEKRLVFRDVAERFFRKRQSIWSPSHQRDVRRMLDKSLFPALGDKSLVSITSADVRNMLDTITERGAVTYAHDVRTYFSAILRFANGERPHTKQIPDPAQFVSVDEPPPATAHAHLQPQEIGAFLRALAQANENPPRATPAVLRAMRVLLLCVCRTGELRQMRWAEIDMAERLWRLSPGRMKARRAHVVPLSDQAVALLTEQRKESGASELVFPSPADPTQKEPLSENALLALIYRLGYRGRMSGHGSRSVFSTWAHEQAGKQGWTSDAVELALAHAPGSAVKMAYMHTTLLPERARMLQAWADFLDAEEARAGGANVIAFPVAAT